MGQHFLQNKCAGDFKIFKKAHNIMSKNNKFWYPCLHVDLVADEEADFNIHGVEVFLQCLIGPDHLGEVG